MSEQEKPKRTYVVQRGVVPIIEQSPAENEAGGTVGLDGVDYVVTLKPAGHPDGVVLWQDYATVEVESGKQRKTIIADATSEIEDGDLPQFFRALDAESGEVLPLQLGVPKPPPKRRMVG